MILAEVRINGRQRKVIMQANKNGFFYVLDRVTGQFISAQPFAQVTWAKGIDPATGRPIVNPEARYGAEPIIIRPGGSGAHNTSPISFNPISGLAYIPTSAASSGTSFVPATYDPKLGGAQINMRGITPTRPEPPAIGPPPPESGVGALVAWDPVAQKMRWRTPGGASIGGGTVTTAGNLVFLSTRDGHLLAYSADKGETLMDIQTGLAAAHDSTGGSRSPDEALRRPAGHAVQHRCVNRGRLSALTSPGAPPPACCLSPVASPPKYHRFIGGFPLMKVYDAAGIRNVALVGHSGAGKTQLASALLFDAGSVNRFGKVDEGTTVTDYDEEEIARKHTLAASLAYLEWNKHKINLIDTPGMANFLGDARAALRVAEAAVVVIDAVSGVQVSTEKVWEYADEQQLPRLLVVNRLDRERASLDRALESMRAVLGRNCVPVQLPIGVEKDFKGVIDLVSMKALTFAADESGTMTEGSIPDAIAADAEAARSALIEMVAEADDSLMERFFETGTLTQDELTAGLCRAVRGSKLFPVFCTSALRNLGVQPLADAIVAYVPSPVDRPMTGIDVRNEPATRPASDTLPCTLWVWKTVADQFAGRITMFRVVSGIVKADTTVHNLTRDAPERFGHLLDLQGKTQTHVPELHAGDLGAVAKLKDTHSGDTLGDKHAGFMVPTLQFAEPVLSYAIEPKSRGDEDKIGPAMQRLREEDPSIAYHRDPQTHELLLSGQGQLHIEVTVAKLRRRFGVEVNLKPPRIPYRETITAKVEAHGRHKKQTGGHGQFGDCKITMEPLPRGTEFEFVDDIFGGSIPRQFVPAVEKGIQDTRVRGYLAGYPVVDFRVTVTDGSYHDVDSSEMAFRLAGRLAFRDGMSRARPTLLEPIMNVEVYAPSDFAGDLMGDLNSRRGRIAGMDQRGAATVIRASVPMSEMLTYEQTLTSTTGGRGSYHMEYSHYDEVPGHLLPKIIAASKAERGEAKDEEE